MEFEQDSLFGEETAAQIFDMLRDIEDLKDVSGVFPTEEKRLTDKIFQIRETILISAVNKINRYLEEVGKDFSCQVWKELKELYLYGQGYHQETSEEKRRRWSAYSRFAYELAKQGKLSENIDLTRDMPL